MYKQIITNQSITNEQNQNNIVNHTKDQRRLKQEIETNVRRGQPEKK